MVKMDTCAWTIIYQRHCYNSIYTLNQKKVEKVIFATHHWFKIKFSEDTTAKVARWGKVQTSQKLIFCLFVCLGLTSL